MNDRLEDIIHDVGAESFAQALVYENISIDADTSLHPCLTNFTRLLIVLRLMNLIVMNLWVDKSFMKLL